MLKLLLQQHLLYGIAAIAVLGWWLKTLSSLSTLFHEVEAARGALVAQLRQRHDLIPDVLKAAREAVQVQIADVENVLEKQSRLLPTGPNPTETMEGQPNIKFKVAIGAHPRLDPSAYLELQKAMKSTEENIAAARRFVEAAIAAYNTAIVSLPDILVARVHGYRKVAQSLWTPAMDAKPDYFG